ncbi:hypothetical protein L861_00170 [Litchfieldella anticariensis FP35 = DSM 16096]|uniref:histidine kinase n=1 Tax=Litchfieldella anticariensis (strain DSM 16096 / CECT 5854 / CIP 108499 / LMG 22089 / FP35) TaxID=1121939 RepID=S2L7G0_LITA3|nr:ATP-binding protein [Halomonas anticariensis]EPC03744.1 hypothetical protein L861_00170 [Halomonas anticariensis FP35 = DSM 16096]
MSNLEDDLDLDALLSTNHRALLLQVLSTLTGVNVELVEHADEASSPLVFNLETLAWLKAELPEAHRQAAVQLFELIMFYAGKYHLAANLHLDVTETSYIELQKQHVALQESKMRYKKLSEKLQERIDEQVKVIERAQRQLYEDARLRAIGQLAAGVAHEINTPVGYIGSNLRVASDYLRDIATNLDDGNNLETVLEDFRELLDESRSGVQRIANIVSDLRIFANIDQAEFANCELNVLLKTACHLLQAEHYQKLAIVQHLNELPKLDCYPAKLSQAFYNVLDNAAKAIGDDGVIHVESRLCGDVIEVVIGDDGCGMSQDTMARVFDPFFTTRSIGMGTGLGLSVVRDIISVHQGEIRLKSHPGQGTRVTLLFKVS